MCVVKTVAILQCLGLMGLPGLALRKPGYTYVECSREGAAVTRRLTFVGSKSSGPPSQPSVGCGSFHFVCGLVSRRELDLMS